MGKWKVRNRRLVRRLAGCDEWDEFDATGRGETAARRPRATRTCSAPSYGGGFVGMSFRFFDPETGLWSIYWADSRRPGLLERAGDRLVLG